MDDFATDDLDSGVTEAHRLEPRVDEEQDDTPVDGVDEGHPGGLDAGGASTPPPASPDPWVGVPPELADLAAKKGWKTPADALVGYREMETLLGKQNTERDAERQAFERERREMLEAMRSNAQPAAPPPVEESVVDRIDWEKFGEFVGGDGEAYKAYSEGIVPLLMQEVRQQIMEEVSAQYGPTSEYVQQQQQVQAFQAEVQVVADEDPGLWEATSEATFAKLREWADSGNPIGPEHVRLAQAEAMREKLRELGSAPPAQPDATPPPPPAQQQPPPVAQDQRPAPGFADLQPLSSTTAVQDDVDPNKFWQEKIRSAVPRFDPNDL